VESEEPRNRAEGAEREARALALLNEVARVVAEGLELQPLLQRITDALVESFDWDHAGFALVDHDAGCFRVAAVASRVPTTIAIGHSRPLGSGIVGMVAATGRPVALDDAASHPEYIEVTGGVRTEVCLPIVRGGEVVAVLNLEDRRRRDLADEFPLIDAVAKQVAGAIANAQLHEDVLRRAQQFELVAELTHATLDAEELDPLLDMLARRLRDRFDLLLVMIYLLEPYTSRLDLRAIASRRPTPDRVIPSLGTGRGIIGRAIHLGRAQLVLDVRSDPDYVQLFEESVAELAIPIRFRGRVLGAFNFENDRPQSFSQEAVSLLQLLCDQLAGVLHLAAVNQKLSETSGELEQTNQRLREMNRALVELSTVDALTGLANRRQFDRALDVEWRRAIRSGQPLSLLMVDIDWFKAYNDSYGHLRGDAALAEVAKTLAGSFTRAGDLVARFGGEEFAALLPATEAQGASELAEQARARIEARGIAHHAAEAGRVLTVSVGVASLVPDARLQTHSLVDEADRALYLAKANGRNCVRPARADAAG
jgi:diguanylate cyclase (GGDEF)-like protein